MNQYTIKLLGRNGSPKEIMHVGGDLMSAGSVAVRAMWKGPDIWGYEVWQDSECLTGLFPKPRQFPRDPLLDERSH